MLLLEGFIKILARTSGETIGKVWQSIQRGYVRGLNLENDRMRRRLAETIKPEFLDELKMLAESDEISAVSMLEKYYPEFIEVKRD